MREKKIEHELRSAWRVIALISGIWCISVLSQAGLTPMDLCTVRPPNFGSTAVRDKSRYLEALKDNTLAVRERSKAANALAGVRDDEVVAALLNCLVEENIASDREVLVKTCTDALAWCALAGNKKALEGLWETLLADPIYAAEGETIMTALLDIEGAEKVLETLLAPLCKRQTRAWKKLRPPFPQNYECAICWFSNAWRGRHFGFGVDPRVALQKHLEQLAVRLASAPDDWLKSVLEDPNGASALEECCLLGYFPHARLPFAEGPVGQVPRALIRGLPKRSPSTRVSVLRWFLQQKCTKLFTFGSLDTDDIRTLAFVAQAEGGELGKLVMQEVKALCYGKEERVINGELSLQELVLSESAKGHPWAAYDSILKSLNLKPGEELLMVPITPWEQLAYVPILPRAGQVNPIVQVLRESTLSPQDLFIAAPIYSRLRWLGAADEIPPEILLARSSSVREEKGFGCAPALLAYAAIHAVPTEKQQEVLTAILQDTQLRLSHKIWLLEYCRWMTYLWGAAGVISAAEFCVEASRYPEENIAPALLNTLLRSFTPERLPMLPIPPGPPPDRSQLPQASSELEEKAWQALQEERKKNWERELREFQQAPSREEVVKAWRAWLERFKRLPVFANAAHN